MAQTSIAKPTTKTSPLSSFSEYLALKLACEKAQKEKAPYVVFKNQTIPLSTAQNLLNDGRVFFEKAPEAKNTATLETQPQKNPNESKPLEKFLQENQSTIKAYEARNQLSTQIGIKTAAILKQSKNPEMVDFLQKSAYNYLIQNPKASKENIVSWLLGVTSQKTSLKNAAKNKVPPRELDQIVDEQMWLENQKVIKETLGGAPLISTPTNPSSAIKSQIASTIKAQNPNMPDQKANSIATHIEQAMQSVGATSSPANTKGFDSSTHAKAIKQILVENGHLDAASQVDPLKELVRLGIISTHEEAVHLFKPTNAPSAGLSFSTPQGKTTFNNARVVNINSQPNEGGQTHPLTITARFLEHHYQTQAPQGQTVFRYIWSQIFGGGSSITQPNFVSYIHQISGARSFSTTNQGGVSFSDLRNTIKLFSNAEGLGAKGLFSKGFSGLKNLLGFGKSAGTLAGTGAKTAAAVNATGAAVVGSGSTIAALPYIAAALLVLGFFIFLTTNRGNLDTTAEVRSNYYNVAQSAFTPIDCGFGEEIGEGISFPRINVDLPKPSDPIAARAWEITDDLYQGFWCFFNRSPKHIDTDEIKYPDSYPELFWWEFFLKNPNPDVSEVSGDAASMFWCTQLTEKAYSHTGAISQWGSLSYMADGQMADFKNRGKFIPSSDVTLENALPGSIVFFHVDKSDGRLANHVGILNHADPGALQIGVTQSNAGTKTEIIDFEVSGIGLMNLSGVSVVGIGTP